MIHPLVKGGTSLLDAYKILEEVGVFQGAHVADLGCGGNGHFVSPTSVMVGKSGHVYALDIQKNVLHNVESRVQLQKITNVSTVWSNLEKYAAARIPEGTCDYAFLVNVLFQNTDYTTIVKEAKRILKADKGHLVVIEWKKAASPLGPPLDFRVDSATLVSSAEKEGYTLVRTFDPGVYHYGLLFKRS